MLLLDQLVLVELRVGVVLPLVEVFQFIELGRARALACVVSGLVHLLVRVDGLA